MVDGSISIDSGFLFTGYSTGSTTSAHDDQYYHEDGSMYSAADGDDAGHGGGAHHQITDFGIGTLVLAMTLGALSRTYLTHVTGLPYTVLLLLLGILFGLVLHEMVFGDMGVVGESLQRWADVDSQIILFVFLPILIFESAFETDVHIFQREFWQVVTLAGPGVVIATIMTGCIVKFVFPYGWSWDLSLMLGGVLSATDPVAVVALLKELGVSERLNVLIEGESLLNDATGIVVFIVFRDAYVGVAESSPAQVLITAVRMSFGGPLIGLVLGMFGSYLLGYIIDDAMTEITLTLIVCFSSFMICESTTLHVSGVLAAVTAGLVMSFYAGGRISPGVQHSMHTFWSMATYVANTVIFFVSGLIIGDRAIFDDEIRGREWGLLCLLYLLLQVVRAAVVFILLPVLTKWGYGMSLKQLVVLAFAGLRGAVGLTLALIFVEDDRIEVQIRSLVLFYVAGIAAMTLVINGSLAGHLVSYLGLDRSTKAETEVFTKACSAIEARLEHKLDLLKGDRFLGDADWEMVWRYIPVSTSKMYWHRIRHGNINLTKEEEEDLHIIRDGMIHKEGLQGELEFRAYQVRKWFTRRILRAPGGVNYNELPYRLRSTWYTYHKTFHHSTTSAGEAEQHRRDMELQRLNAEPRMMLEAEAWSSLNAGGGGDDDSLMLANQTPVSYTLRKHLDNVGMLDFQKDSGMMSEFGRQEMAKQAAGTKSGTRPGSGRGGPEALRMVQGIDDLKEDRRRARQAVAQAEARLARLKKDMGLVKHKGEEEEMKEYMQQAAQGLILTSASMHGTSTAAAGSSGKALRRQKSLPDSRPAAAARSGKVLQRQRSLDSSISANDGRILRRQGSPGRDMERQGSPGRILRRQGSPGRHLERQGSPGRILQRQRSLDSSISANDGRILRRQGSPGRDMERQGSPGRILRRPGSLGRDMERQGSPGRILRRQGSPGRNLERQGSPGRILRRPGSPSRSLQRQRSLGSDSNASHKSSNSNNNKRAGGYRPQFDLDDEKQQDDDDFDDVGMPLDGSNRNSFPGGVENEEGGDGHEVRVKNDGAPEWNPYEDSDEEDGGSNPRLAMRNPVVTAPISSGTVVGPKGDSLGGMTMTEGVAVTMDSMSEARVRFLTAVKAHYSSRYHQGWLTSMGLRVLKANMDLQLDHGDSEMNQWSHLSEAFEVPRRLASSRKIPLVGSLLESFMYRRLTFIFELASNFISAHEDVDILELLQEGPVAYQLAYEKNRQLQDARATLAQQLPVFPELARSLKTRVAAKYMLFQHRAVVGELFKNGHINERESEGLIAENNNARVKLEYHPTADEIPDRFTLLKNVPFLRFLSDEDKAKVINNEKACQEEFYGSNVVLMNEKTSFAKGHRRQGWFNVVRGAVRQNTEGMVGHQSSGGTPRVRKLAKERLVNAGTVIGLDEQLMEAPYHCTYTTASFVHLFFFDKTQMLILAEQYPGLKRGLWWLLAVSVVRHHHGFRRMNLAGVHQLMKTAEFKEFKSKRNTSMNESRHQTGTIRGFLNSSRHAAAGVGGFMNSSRHSQSGGGLNSSHHGGDTRPAIVRAAASLNESRHKLTKGLRRTVSRHSGNVSEQDLFNQPHSPDAPSHAIVLEGGSNILLLKGTIRRRLGSVAYSSLREQKAVTIVRDVSGPVEFAEGSVVFIMPAVLMARASAGHQLLMRDIVQRHRDEEIYNNRRGEGDGGGLTSAALESEAYAMEGGSPGSRWNRNSSEKGAIVGPSSPSKEREVTFSGRISQRNAAATDAFTMAAAEEANPERHPDAVRRRRTLRDAALASKATPTVDAEPADATATAPVPATAESASGSGDVEAPWIGRRITRIGGRTHVVAPDHSTARLSLGSRQGFVEMQNVPVTSNDIGVVIGAVADNTPKGGRASRQQQQQLALTRSTLDI